MNRYRPPWSVMARPTPSKFGSSGAGWCSRLCRYPRAALVCQISATVSGTGRPPESRTWPNPIIRCPCGSPACCVVRSASLQGDQVVAEPRPGHLGEPLREEDERLLGWRSPVDLYPGSQSGSWLPGCGFMYSGKASLPESGTMSPSSARSQWSNSFA